MNLTVCCCVFVRVLQPEAPQQCTPSAARRAVKAHPDLIPALNRQQQLVPLLAYCLRDVDLSTGPTGGWLQQLMGLRLLPLADGQGVAAVEVTMGSAQSQQQLVFVVVDALEQALVQTERECCSGSVWVLRYLPGPLVWTLQSCSYGLITLTACIVCLALLATHHIWHTRSRSHVSVRCCRCSVA